MSDDRTWAPTQDGDNAAGVRAGLDAVEARMGPGCPDATVVVVGGADHFLAGAAGRVADTVLAWLRDTTGSARRG